MVSFPLPHNNMQAWRLYYDSAYSSFRPPPCCSEMTKGEALSRFSFTETKTLQWKTLTIKICKTQYLCNYVSKSAIYKANTLWFFVNWPMCQEPGPFWKGNLRSINCSFFRVLNELQQKKKTVECTWSIRMADVECSKSNPQKQQVLHLAACLCAVSPGVSEGCKLQWEWVVIADLWTNISLMVTPSVETKINGRNRHLPLLLPLLQVRGCRFFTFGRNQT